MHQEDSEIAGSEPLELVDTRQHVLRQGSRLLEECMESFRQTVKQVVRTALLALRLAMLPLVLLLREVLGPGNIPHRTSMLRRPLVRLHSAYSSMSKRVAFIYARAIAYMALPMNILRTLDRLTTLLKQQIELNMFGRTGQTRTAQQEANRPESQNSSMFSITSEATPSSSPATATQMYHAAILNNNTLDDLLAAFDGGKTLPPEDRLKTEDETQVQVRNCEDACHEANTERGKPGILRFEPRLLSRPQRIRNLSSASLPLRPFIRPGEVAADSPYGNDYIYESCPSIMEPFLTPGVDNDVHPDRGSNATSKMPEPVLRCSACEGRSSGSEQSSIKESKPKARFDTSMSTYHTVLPTRKSKVPRRTRPWQAKAG